MTVLNRFKRQRDKKTADKSGVVSGVQPSNSSILSRTNVFGKYRKVLVIALLVVAISGVSIYFYAANDAEDPKKNQGIPTVTYEGEEYIADYLVADDTTDYAKSTPTIDEQIKAGEDAISAGKNDYETWLGLAELYLAKNDIQKAINGYEHARALADPSLPTYNDTIASIDKVIKELKDKQVQGR